MAKKKNVVIVDGVAQQQEMVGIFKKRPKYDEEGREIHYKKKKLFKSRVCRNNKTTWKR